MKCFLHVNSFCEEVLDPSLLQPSPLLVGMATCHSLTIIDNNIAGDPLDVIMFNSLGWVICHINIKHQLKLTESYSNEILQVLY